MRRLALCIGLLCCVAAAAPASGADRLSERERRREVRKRRRKVKQKVVEAKSIGEMARDTTRLEPKVDGVSGKVTGRKLEGERLARNLAVRVRELFKLAQEKLEGQRTLRAEIEAEERRAKKLEKQRQEQRLRRKRKVDLTIFFDW